MGLNFDLCTAQFTAYDLNGFIGLQVDAMGQDTASPPWELHHPFGFSSRPRDPDITGKGCNVLKADEGDTRGHCWLAADPRAMGLLPKVAKGGSLQYAWTGGIVTYASFDGDTGSYLLKVGTQEIAVGIDGSLSLSALGGLAKIEIGASGVKVTSLGTTIEAGPMGVTVSGPSVTVNALATVNVTAPAVAITAPVIAMTGNVAITGNVAFTGTILANGTPMIIP